MPDALRDPHVASLFELMGVLGIHASGYLQHDRLFELRGFDLHGVRRQPLLRRASVVIMTPSRARLPGCIRREARGRRLSAVIEWNCELCHRTKSVCRNWTVRPRFLITG